MQLAGRRVSALRIAIIAVCVAGSSLNGAATAQSDVPSCLGRPATIVGTNGDDVLRGTARNDVIAGLAGNDRISNSNPVGVDVLCGGDGNDVIGGNEDETGFRMLVSGDAGDDRIDAGVITYQDSPVAVRIDMGTGRITGWGTDSLNAEEPSRVAVVIGSQHDDVMIGSSDGGSTLVGLGGNDSFLSRRAADLLVPGPGDDLLDGGSAGSPRPCALVAYNTFDRFSDRVGGIHITVAGSPAPIRVDLDAGIAVGWGRDRLRRITAVAGSDFSDVLLGTRRGLRGCLDGGDELKGEGGNDVLVGRGGSDSMWGGRGHDLVDGGNGDDTISGESGNDRLRGGSGRDGVFGASGNDRLFGGPDRDLMIGGANDDRLDGGRGGDLLDGGAGSDRLDGGPGNDACRNSERKVRCERR